MLEFRESPRNVTLPAIQLEQPVGKFFICSIPALALYEICKFDIRKMSQSEGIDEFLGIQREVNPKRLSEIKHYITTQDATFPTAAIIAVDERCCAFAPLAADPRMGVITLSNYLDKDDANNDILYRDIAKVLDGQHRIKAFENGCAQTFELNVAIFVGADIATQAEIFSTVNLAQTKVNKSLVYDLFSMAKTRSPEKSAHEITVLLDRRHDSPFHQLIKRLGVATSGRIGETLSQATVVRGILSHITKDVLVDREIGKRQREWAFKSGDEYRFIFRYSFVKGEDDKIFLNILNYFKAVKDKWPKSWADRGTGNILVRTNGYLAFMRFMRPAVLSYDVRPNLVPKEHFEALMSKIDLPDGSFTTDNYPPGTSGETRLYRDLLDKSGLPE